MSIHIPADQFYIAASEVAVPNIRQDIDRSFGLPPILHIATFGLYFGFLAVMSVGLGTRELTIPLAICFVFLAMAAAVPAKWVMMKPVNKTPKSSWINFVQDGVETYTGQMQAKDVLAQVLILPILIFLWSIAIVAMI